MRNGPPGYRRAQQLFLLLGAALGACGGLGREPSRLELDPVLAKSGSGPVVSGRQVVGRLETLGAFGPRTSGSQAAERARRYIRLELERIGLATEEWKLDLPLSEGPSAEGVHIIGRLPGTQSADVFLLVTPYTGSWSPEAPGPCARASHAGSGVALLLELSRALSEHPLPYETWFAFVDEGPEATEPARPPAGSLSLAHALAESGKLERIRLAVFVAGVGEANLRVPRDLSSNRMFRERFFRVAARLGHEDIFAPEGNYASLRTGHRAFEQVGQGGVVAIVGSVPASDEDGSLREEAAETLDPDPEQACSSQTLRAVGEVNLGALDELAALLQRLDCIGSSRRAAAPPETSAAPGNE